VALRLGLDFGIHVVGRLILPLGTKHPVAVASNHLEGLFVD
jgi:hypothetical protein